MRTIRFRGWNPETKEMKIGLNAISVVATDTLTLSQDELVLMQYTGLKDKHGKEIYESDIVKGIVSDNPHFVCEGLKQSNLMGKEVTGFIDYINTYAQFRFTTDEITYLAFPFGLLEPEVIGNVYENPDLIHIRTGE